MADYPVYEKNGRTQLAATPQREVELQFDGWTRVETKSAAPASEPDPPTSPAPDADPAPARRTKPTK